MLAASEAPAGGRDVRRLCPFFSFHLPLVSLSSNIVFFFCSNNASTRESTQTEMEGDGRTLRGGAYRSHDPQPPAPWARLGLGRPLAVPMHQSDPTDAVHRAIWPRHHLPRTAATDALHKLRRTSRLCVAADHGSARRASLSAARSRAAVAAA